MKSLLLLLLFLPTQTFAQALGKESKLCVVISGDKKDHNNFVDEKLFKTGEKVAGVDCKVFNNWKDAKSYAHQNLIKNGKLLVVQGAHGNENGTYEVNDGPVSAESIYNDLKELSGSFHVGSVIHSCYSASIMNLKLLDDEVPGNKLDKLCLVSSSSFGRITYSHPNDMIQNLLKLKPGQSLESPFLNTRAGVISSAAWSEVALPEFLMAKTTEKGFKTLEKMDTLMRGGAECTNPAEITSALCLSPTITDETFEDIRAYLDPEISSDKKGYLIRNLTNHIADLKNDLKVNPKKPGAAAGLVCKESLLKLYQTRFGPTLKDLKTYPDVIKLREEIYKTPFYKNECLQYAQTLEKGSWERDSLATDAMHLGAEEYLNSLKRLEDKYKSKKLGTEFDMHRFLSTALEEKKVCAPGSINSKEKIIQSLFGLDFFMDEYSSDFNGSAPTPDEMIHNRSISTQILLKGFQDSALLKPSLKNPKDVERRKACQNFKF